MIRIFTSKSQKIGEKGENETVSFLMKQGYKIVERNLSNKFGEIDIVALKDKTTYFFEVKAGRSGGYIAPAENFHPEKLRKFLKSVEYCCFTRNITDYRVQGIVVLFSYKEDCAIEIIDLF